MTDEANMNGGTEGDDSTLVAEFVLGVLEAPEHERVARRIAAEPALQEQLRFWQGRLSALDSGFAETPAPAGSWERLEAHLFGSERTTRTGGWWDSLLVWRGLAGGALAVAVAAVGFNLMQPARLDPNEFAVQLVAALQSQEGSGVEFVAFYDTGTGSVRLLGLSGEQPTDRDFELWYIEGDEPAVSMGVIPVDQRTEISLDEAARGKIGEGTLLAVTLEQKGGSPTGVAQGPIVAAGPALAI